MHPHPEPGGRRFLLRRIGREKLGCDFVSDAADRLVVGVPDAECIAAPGRQHARGPRFPASRRPRSPASTARRLLGDHVLQHAHLRADPMSAFSAMSMLVSSATGNDSNPIFGRIRPPHRECNRAPRVDLDGRLVYATDSNQDLIFWMDARLSC
jgi:hypothetical protein